MARNAYGIKEFENNEIVIYRAGSNYESPTGKIQFNKLTLELTILKSEEGSKVDWALFKVASKAKNIYKDTGNFPDRVESAS